MAAPQHLRPQRRHIALTLSAMLLLVTPLLITLSSCGGGSALDNAATLNNPGRTGSQKLSFAYFQRCVNPVLITPLPIPGAPPPNTGTSTCAAGGCHDNITGTGGALRLVGGAVNVNLTDTPDSIRNSDMYKNYYSSLGSSVVGAPELSAMLNKPLVRGVSHGGGVVFGSADDLAARALRYWINRPVPEGQDEFSSSANSMFTPADAVTGRCNIP
jgi:hypothetical protein